ncbi:TlpA disulfide reductase family protein [Marinobacter nanhaiticus D15-8W]|uniref:TlpA family protein disulfide reductase n=1 Tax=Marinobacter nanhaiticus D15-8W TaxID=626887 RepID=N6VX77_9GAMM|nr:TlpA disulfide reductase family protein [Marinobacter nanhaiticus]ENO14850.1 TlpA family protein disulfide reductase [Marinobacter nanhaiticus D15-8W]BES69456.1 TlpA disulfide reductase family protein [Marinobacter nanhaiticus D15-8W]
MLTVNLGPLSLPTGHLLLLLAFIVALVVGGLSGRKQKTPVAGMLSDILVVAAVSARIGFVLMYFEHYRDNLWDVVDIRDGGFSVIAGVAGALACTAYLMWRSPVSRRPLGFAMASGMIVWGTLLLTINLIETQANAVPDARFATLDGTGTTLAEIGSGKPMVVNLWASWCPPCIREMPVLDAAQERLPNVSFVFVNQGEQPETIRRFLADQALELDHILTDPGGALGRITGSQALPTTLFFNAAGQQVDAHLGELSRATLARSLEQITDDESP